MRFNRSMGRHLLCERGPESCSRPLATDNPPLAGVEGPIKVMNPHPDCGAICHAERSIPAGPRWLSDSVSCAGIGWRKECPPHRIKNQ